jgi:hypothetical protein
MVAAAADPELAAPRRAGPRMASNQGRCLVTENIKDYKVPRVRPRRAAGAGNTRRSSTVMLA